MPRRAAAAAVMRAKLDCGPPAVTSVSQPRALASATRYSSLRALLPPRASPVWSSRFTRMRIPRTSERRGADSSGVGKCAREIRSTRRILRAGGDSAMHAPAPSEPELVSRVFSGRPEGALGAHGHVHEPIHAKQKAAGVVHAPVDVRHPEAGRN